jgi:hypothetical protein
MIETQEEDGVHSAKEIVTDLQYMEGQHSNLHERIVMDTKTIRNYQYKVNQETSWKDRMKKVL